MRLGMLVLAFALLNGAVVATRTFAQVQTGPEFEVVSIKPSRLKGGALITADQKSPEMLSLTGIRLKDLIARAYSLQPYQVIGPAKIDEEFYDIAAKAGEVASDSRQRQMLISMLADRFHLEVRFEVRELPCYELTIGKGGLKITPVASNESQPRYYPNARPTAIRARSISLQTLAELLSSKADRPVIDGTGAVGNFDIELNWIADFGGDNGPSLPTALQEQLGLSLQSRRMPVRLLLIEHIEKPSEN